MVNTNRRPSKVYLTVGSREKPHIQRTMESQKHIDLKSLKALALNVVRKASLLAEKHAGHLKKEEILIKKDNSPVTLYDFVLQALITHELLSFFPTIPIMAEEESSILKESENSSFANQVVHNVQKHLIHLSASQIFDEIDKSNHKGGRLDTFWVLDPIDGTRGFIENDQYAVALALIDKGKVVLGLLGCPRLLKEEQGALFVAERGKGAELFSLESEKRAPLRLEKQKESHDLIYCEPKLTIAHHSHELAEKLVKRLHLHATPFRLDSQCKYAAVALGLASIYLRIPKPFSHQEKIWDHAAGVIVLEEAGGKVTDLFGQPLDFGLGDHLVTNRGLIATDGLIHDKAVQIAKELFS